jgi:hypothetical protein
MAPLTCRLRQDGSMLEVLWSSLCLGLLRTQSDVRLPARSLRQIGDSLSLLRPGGQGWIGFEDVAALFPLPEHDSGRIPALEAFAAQH